MTSLFQYICILACIMMVYSQCDVSSSTSVFSSVSWWCIHSVTSLFQYICILVCIMVVYSQCDVSLPVHLYSRLYHGGVFTVWRLSSSTSVFSSVSWWCIHSVTSLFQYICILVCIMVVYSQCDVSLPVHLYSRLYHGGVFTV